MSEKKLNIKDYVLDSNYITEKMEYDEEIDGNLFPDRDEHLKQKDNVREKYKDLKDSIAKSRVRR